MPMKKHGRGGFLRWGETFGYRQGPPSLYLPPLIIPHKLGKLVGSGSYGNGNTMGRIRGVSWSSGIAKSSLCHGSIYRPFRVHLQYVSGRLFAVAFTLLPLPMSLLLLLLPLFSLKARPWSELSCPRRQLLVLARLHLS